MKSLLALLVCCSLLAVTAASVTNKPGRQFSVKNSPGFTRDYSQFGQAGQYYDFTDYVPNLAQYGFDNMIRSLCQTGMWMYYEQVDYNQQAGVLLWVHGIEYCSDMSNNIADKTSSLRYAGSPYSLNGDCFTLYQGEFFTGSEYWGDQAYYPNIDYMAGDSSSLVINGVSPWTFYTSENYRGQAVCVYPNTDHDVVNDVSIDFGIYRQMSQLGLSDNSIRSVAKGCYSKTVINAAPLHTIRRDSNGAVGFIHKGGVEV